MEKFENLLEKFIMENDCEIEVIEDAKYGGRLLKIYNGKKIILQRIEHLFLPNCTDDQIRNSLEAVKTLF